MALLALLEKAQTGINLSSLDRELLESIELHLRSLVDVMGLYVECARQPDDQIRRILSRLEEKLYGLIQASEGGTLRGVEH
jgi:hypothetical protein